MGGSASKSNIINQINEIVASVLTNVALHCNASTADVQQLQVDCDPLSTFSTNKVYESNSVCFDGYQTIKEQYFQIADIRNRAAVLNSSSTSNWDLLVKSWYNGTQPLEIRKNINDEFREILNTFINHGIRCKACVVSDISQSQTVVNIASCTSFNNLENNLNSQLADHIAQTLTDHQDALSPLAQIIGVRTQQQVVTNLTQRVRSHLTTNIIQNIRNAVQNNQVIKFQGSSTLVQGQTQNNITSSVINFLQKNQIFNTVFTDEEFNAIQNLKSDTTTISALGSFIARQLTALEKLSSSIMGRITYAVVGAVALLFVALVTFAIIQSIRKALLKEHQRDAQSRKLLLQNAKQGRNPLAAF